MKKHMRLLAIVMVAMMTMALTACGWLPGPVDPTEPPVGADVVAPVITVSGVPETCKVGDEVTVPAATATDDVDGDISANIKVTVSQMKEDGVTVNRDLIYQKPGNVEQTFNAGSNKLLVYKITYVVKDAAGNQAKAEYTLTAVADNETGSLTMTDAPAVIKGTAASDVKLPAAVAIDQPGDVNISSLITASLYEIVGGEKSSVLFAKWEDFTDVKIVRIPAGNYVLVYSVKDAAGNAFETTYEIPVEIGQPGEVNLALDPKNFALDEKDGMSWINEFGLVSFGHTSAKDSLDQTVGMTENVTKIYDQYVAITFNADAPTMNGQMFYSLAARGSKDRNTMPNKETCTWPSYLFLRIGTGRIESRVEKSSDKEMTQVKGYDKSLLDGKDHTLYVQWKNVGESATAADAAIYIYGWVDQTPAVGYDNADFIFKAVAGDTINEGVLTHELFAELWNETGAGWLSMDTYGNKTPYDDDHMRIKGLVIYDASETEFGVDITPPTVDVNFSVSGILATNEPISIPNATFAGEKTTSVYMVQPDGTKVDVSGSYTPTVAGTYTLVYLAVDENDNQGYRTFTITVADRDEVAPELTLGSQENLEINAGETVVLPGATAVDAKDGELSGSISIEIIGTEHITDLLPGGKYTPMTAGVQTVIYRVSDSFGNTAEKSFTITVKSTTSGQLLAEPMGIGHPGKGLTASQYVYDEKVSMVLNIEKHNVVMFNLRGPVKNTEWPNGLVLRFTNDGISLSGHGHDANIYGNTNWEFWKFRLGNDILFEYQVKNVVIDGVEYIRVQAWINGKALVWTGVADRGGLTGLEEGVNAIYRKVSDFTSNEAEADNIYSSPFFAAVYQGSMVVKELRMDGQSCACPADPVIPDGYEINFGSGHNFVTGPVQMGGNSGDFYELLGQNSNEDYIAITFKGSAASKGALCLNLTGTAEGWSGGLFTRLTNDGLELRVSGPNNDPCAWLGGGVYAGGINDKEYTLVYKLTYITDAYGYSTGVQIEVWLGEAGGKLTKCQFAATNNSELITTNEAKDATIISSKAFSSAANMTPSEIKAVILGALNGECAWTITKIETLAGDPDKAVAGWENILNNDPAQVLLNDPFTVPAGQDGCGKVVANLNENVVAVTLSHTSEQHRFYINMTGSCSGWDGGLGLRLGHEGMMLNLGGVNSTELAQLNFYSLGANDEDFTVAYKLTYLVEGGKYYGLQIEIWAGPASGTLTKIGAHAIKDSRVTYDAEKGAFIVKYDIVDSAEKFKPDCTLSAMGAFNGGCAFTVKKVEILPVAPGTVLPGWENILNSNDSINKFSGNEVFSANTDKAVNLVSDLNEDYVLMNFKLSDASKYVLYVNMTGSSGGWDGGIGLRISNDGLYLKCNGVNTGDFAQTNIYGGALAADTEYTLCYKLTYLQEGGKYYAVQIEMWAGAKGGEQMKIGCHAVQDTEHCSYDAEKGAFIVKYDAVDSADKFKPDCTVVALGAFNPTCEFTITHVEVVEAG